MQFIDLNDDRVYSLQDLHRDWAQFRQEDPENHAPDFKTELFEILMATINGRNDLEILGMTHREISSLTLRKLGLRSQINTILKPALERSLQRGTHW